MTEHSLILMVPREDTESGENDKIKRMESVLSYALSGIPCDMINRTEELKAYLKNCRSGTVRAGQEKRRILFAVFLGGSGVNLEYVRMIRFLREDKDALDGFTGGILVDADSDLYTKSIAGELAFTANCAGCAFIGKPLVEGTKTLSNFAVIASNMQTDTLSAYKESARLLVRRLLDFKFSIHEKPNLLVLHASSHETSNTFALWNEVKAELPGFSITEIGLRNGMISDCAGCPYKMCLHFGEQGSCFYGGVMVEEVYPAVKKADAVVMLCPNYNDALSANLTAFINRLTALFRTYSFQDKALFGVVVSGYSGSDIVAAQLICALNMNKAFYLPGGFCLMETANDAGSALKLPGIGGRLPAFAALIRRTLTLKTDGDAADNSLQNL